ncbi:hypothetical protein NDU88_004495, partial [Pleurodeles waltl]
MFFLWSRMGKHSFQLIRFLGNPERYFFLFRGHFTHNSMHCLWINPSSQLITTRYWRCWTR